MLKHCVDDEGLLILQRLNFPEDDCANNMQSKLEKLEMYCSKQTKHLFEHFKLRQKHCELYESFVLFVAALRDIMCKIQLN